MSQQGTWCDTLIIQAVAEKLNITESYSYYRIQSTFRRYECQSTFVNPLFADMNVIGPLHFTEGVQTIHLGHIDELRYVSTVQLDFAPGPVNNNTVLVTSETNSALSKENNLKRKRNAYMRE